MINDLSFIGNIFFFMEERHLIFWFNHFSCNIFYFRVLWRLIKFKESISSVMELEQQISGRF